MSRTELRSECCATALGPDAQVGKGAICWCALRTRARHEKVVRGHLGMQNIEYFLPTVMRWSQWKDRMKQIELPLFSGYCFARFSLDRRFPVLQLPGVVDIVGEGGRPQPIPDREIESFRILVNSCFRYDPHPYLEEGVPIEVIEGPLRGVKGRLVRNARHCRLVVGIRLIRQAAVVEMDASSIASASHW